MRIAILGSGGVGGYFGGRLAAAGADVTFIARGRHLAALREHGLRIESPRGNLHLRKVKATDDLAAVGPADIVFFAVKLYDTQAALRLLPSLIGGQTLVVPFQNGVDSVGVLADAIGREHVAGGTAYVAAVIAELEALATELEGDVEEAVWLNVPRLGSLADTLRAIATTLR